MSTTVTNLTSPRSGEPVKNQFIIISEGVETFQSYDTTIAKKEGVNHTISGYTISGDYNYSVTTSKYFNQWLKYNGFNDVEIQTLKKWLSKAKDGDVLVELLDEHGNYPGQAESELEAFQNSLEGRLIEFTTDELVKEINDRTLRLCAGLKARTDHLASLVGVVLPEDKPF